MSNITYSIVKTEDREFITVCVPGHDPLPASSDHPNYRNIVSAVVTGEAVEIQDLRDLFDVGQAIVRGFSRLSERVAVEGDNILLDGDPVENGLTKQILRFMDEGEDFEPLVNFMEKIEANPNDHSRAQAWDWLNNHDFTIAPEGDVVGYKGVHAGGPTGYQSGWAGEAIRNGERVNGKIPNAVGDVIEMPRSDVAHNPSASCSFGLHVGTYRYAQSYAQGAMLRVIVNPRDIVSVPTDAGGEKIRVCRYTVDAIIDAPETSALLRNDSFEEDGEGGDGCDPTYEREYPDGTRIIDCDGDVGTIEEFDGEDNTYFVNYETLGLKTWLDALAIARVL